jgi:S-adenosylmethionine decarboxylase
MVLKPSVRQLGIDLDESSSAPEASVAASPRKNDHFSERDGKRFAGLHLLVDLWGAERLDDLDYIDSALRKAVAAAGATLLHVHLHHFGDGGGVSGVAVIAESHISVHTWPEYGFAAFDVFMCGNSRPEAAVQVLRRAFKARRAVVSQHRRGLLR